MVDGGMSFITGAFAAGAAGFAGATGAAGFSAAAGFASSSAMMRRIDARISSIEGSWTFAGCVISDSKSSTPSHALSYTKHHGIGRFRLCGLRDLRRRPDLSPDQHGANRRAAPPRSGHRSVMARTHARHESLDCLCKGYVMAINDCKQRPVPRADSHRAIAALCAAAGTTTYSGRSGRGAVLVTEPRGALPN